MNIGLIEQKFNALPNDLKKEALDFIDFLMTKKRSKSVSGQFDFIWEGSLSEFKESYNSVDLQHQSAEWR